jgi:hypothetical protein
VNHFNEACEENKIPFICILILYHCRTLKTLDYV